MDVKTCFKCNQEKQLKEFYRHKGMGDGYLGKCKKCTKKDVIESRNARIDYYREYDRNRANLPSRVEKRREVAERWKSDQKLKKRTIELKKAWQDRNAIKRAAHIITGNAIKRGDLIKQSCEICGKKKVEAHHDDYSFPLDIRWLCKKHHAEYHKKERENQRINQHTIGRKHNELV